MPHIARPARTARRVFCLAVMTAALLAVAAGPAAAHGRGSDATNFRSTVLSAPDEDGLRWRILGGDSMLELHNPGPEDVIVIGLQDEPYLRIGPRGVFENRRSPTVPLHRERYATSTDMAGMDHGEHDRLDPEAPPEWVRVSAEPRWAWHDHRIHWMSPRPPDVRGETVVIPRWEVPVLVGGEPATVSGELRWIPAPSPLPWLGAGLLLSLPALWGLRHLRGAETDAGPGAPRPSAIRPACVVLAAAALLSAAHLVDDVGSPGPGLDKAFAALQTLLYLGLAIGGAWRGRSGDYAGVTALGIGAGALFLGQGLLYLTVLGSSQIGHGAPAWLLRLAVGAALGQLVPVGIAVWRVGRLVQPDDQATAGLPES